MKLPELIFQVPPFIVFITTRLNIINPKLDITLLKDENINF